LFPKKYCSNGPQAYPADAVNKIFFFSVDITAAPFYSAGLQGFSTILNIKIVDLQWLTDV